MRNKKRNLTADLMLGTAAGAAATWIMDKVTTALYERESKTVQNHENKARGKKTAYEIAAERGAGLADRTLTSKQRKQFGAVIHWSLGIGAGASYGLLRNRVRSLGVGSGLLYGLAFWLVMDEAALALLGLTPAPTEFPWQTHARGLAGHLVMGAVLEAPFDAADLLR